MKSNFCKPVRISSKSKVNKELVEIFFPWKDRFDEEEPFIFGESTLAAAIFEQKIPYNLYIQENFIKKTDFQNSNENS